MWISKKHFRILQCEFGAQKRVITSGEKVIDSQDNLIKSLNKQVENMKKYVKLADLLVETNKKVDNDETI